MTQTITNNHFEITYYASDFVNEFVSLEEVDFADMKARAIRVLNSHKESGMLNVQCSLFPKAMKYIMSFDKP